MNNFMHSTQGCGLGKSLVQLRIHTNTLSEEAIDVPGHTYEANRH